MICHTVVFKLKFAKGSVEEAQFLHAAAKLAALPAVLRFESLRQTSAKNDFDYGLSMEFDSQKAYDDYSNHPDHAAFIKNYWIGYVEKFLEIDYEQLDLR